MPENEPQPIVDPVATKKLDPLEIAASNLKPGEDFDDIWQAMATGRTDDRIEPPKSEYQWDTNTCIGCLKKPFDHDIFLNFIFAIVRGKHAITGEDLVRDGIFDGSGKLAKLRACPHCAPYILRFLKSKPLDASLLPKGPFYKIVSQILKRANSTQIITH